MKITALFRNCAHCGKTFGFIDLFCKKCWIKLEHFKASPHFVVQKTSKVKVRPLFLWTKKESIVGDLILGLKGGAPTEALEKLCREISLRNNDGKNCLLVPVPSSKVEEKDHAFKMAECIAKESNLEFCNGLRWNKKKNKQKFLKKTERFESEMVATIRLAKNTRVILIDDVVTTGATAMAACEAFKGLNHIEVWALACRF